MLVSKEEVVSKVRSAIKRHISDVNLMKERLDILVEKYDFPVGVASDVLTLRIDIDTLTDFQLFCVLSIVNGKYISKFFTSSEIEMYSKSKYIVDTIKFPLRFNMVRITSDQYIGRISVRDLMKLRDAQLINYNENAQRTMKHVVDGNAEYYKIYLNQKAVNGIQNSFQSDLYIPNTITLNIPEDTVFDYKDGELTIASIDHFDILDGYHRYIAISKLVNINPAFNYTMELRLVQFDEGKAKQFIWQEDQKTKMRKADSESFNQNDIANKIVNQLNTENGFVLAGYISRNAGIINSVEFAKIIKLLFIDEKLSKENSLKQSIAIKKLLKDKLSVLVNNDPDIIGKQWDCKLLASACVCIYNEISDDDLVDSVKKIYSNYSDKVNVSTLTKRILTRMSKLI